MSSNLQEIGEIIGHIPKPERIVLAAHLETVNMKAVEADGESAAYIILQARFQVTNTSGNAANVWNVTLELIPSLKTLADRLRQYAYANSHDVILPSQTKTKNVDFGFHVLKNDRLPLLFPFRALMETVIRFHTVSENFIGEPQSQAIKNVVNTDMLFYTVQNVLRNKLSWH